MTAEPLRLTVHGDVATLTITSKMGSFTADFWPRMVQAYAELEQARVLILRGEQVFSAGLDLRSNLPDILPTLGDERAFAQVVQKMQAVNEGMAALPIPVIAAVHGWCIGAGLELICAADLRLCSADARFSLPEVKLGITADLGGLQRLPHLIGRSRTAHLALTGEPIDAATAERWGLVTEVLPTPEALWARTEALAAQLAQLPAQALEGTKRILHDELAHHDGMGRAAAWNAQHLIAEDLQAALAALGQGQRKTDP